MIEDNSNTLNNMASPAMIDLSPQNSAVITNGLKNLLKLKTLVISENVFVKKSRLVIERREHSSLSGSLMNDRSSERPYIIFLKIDAHGCFLREQSGKIERLNNLVCRASEG